MLEGYSSEQLISEVIRRIGDDPAREGVKETPQRVVRAWGEIFGGYSMKVEDSFKTFAEPCDEMIVAKGIEFFSTCEHHMLPFFGEATIGYIPDKRVIGASKLARIFEVYARRLQIQERLGKQVTQALVEHLRPKGCGVVVKARHFCMVCRGVKKPNTTFITSSLEGAFREGTPRAEFLSFVNSAK